MSTIIVACKTLQNELAAAMSACGYSCEIRWIESGLHNFPKKLHNTLQDLLDQCTDCDTVLLAMGFCGNSVAGIQTHDFQLVMPLSLIHILIYSLPLSYWEKGLSAGSHTRF